MSRNFRLLYFDQLLSTFANATGTFSLSWVVFQITNSPVAMSGLWFVSILAQLIAQFGLAPYLDQFHRKHIMRSSEAVRFVCFAGALVMVYSHSHFVWGFYGCALFSSCSMYAPAANALVPATVPNEKLVKANAHILSSVQLIQFLSYPMAGWIVGSVGPETSLLFSSLSLGASLILIQAIQDDGRIPVRAPWLAQFKKGVQVYRQTPLLLILGLFIALVNFGVSATQSMYLPFIETNLSGTSVQYGLFSGCFPLGYFIGARLVSRVRFQESRLRFMFGAIAYGGLTFLLLSIVPYVSLALLIEFSAGVVMPFWGVNSTTLYQRIVPPELRSQVFAVRSMIAQCAAPLGVGYSALVCTQFGIPFVFRTVGLFTIVLGVIGMLLVYRGRLVQPNLPDKATLQA